MRRSAAEALGSYAKSSADCSGNCSRLAIKRKSEWLLVYKSVILDGTTDQITHFSTHFFVLIFQLYYIILPFEMDYGVLGFWGFGVLGFW